MQQGELYPEHEKLLEEAIKSDRILCKLISSKAFHQMNKFLRNLGTEKTINRMNRLDLTDPNQLKLLIEYKRLRKRITQNFREAMLEYEKYEKGVDKHVKRR